jgi:pyruvate formate lyase activating enzyme
MKDAVKGLIFDIQKFSLHDGHGIRTLVFMKGCPLRCSWCSNPESQKRAPEILFFEENCISCKACLAACPEGEVIENYWPTDRDVCTGCGACVDVCYSESRTLVGENKSVTEILEKILQDKVFYDVSGGGVTIGGGEPTMQADFVSSVLKECRHNGIHTALETCGHTDWKNLAKILEQTQLLLFDLKHMDSQIHRQHTGVTNDLILMNAKRSMSKVEEMVIRLPLIKNVNDSHDNIKQLGLFIQNELPKVSRVDVLPYHSTGESKCKRLGTQYPLTGLEPFTSDEVSKVTNLLADFDLEVVVGGG